MTTYKSADTSLFYENRPIQMSKNINQDTFCHVYLEYNSGKFWMFAVWSDKFAKCSIKAMCAVWSVKCVVWSVQVQVQVQVQCVVYTVQCAVCSVLPATGKDLKVETG